MLLPRFEYHEPGTVRSACRLLHELGGEAKALAGGTDLLVNMKKGLIRPSHLVSLEKIAPMRRMETHKKGLTLGAMARVAALAEWEGLNGWASALREGAMSLGTPLVRNRATLGGNLVTARPAADLAPPLMILGARVLLRDIGGERELMLEDFFLGPGDTAIRPGEILGAVRIDAPPPLTGSAYMKMGTRRTLEIALVNVAAALTLEAVDGPIARARVALGAVGPVPLRAGSAEACLMGNRPSESLFAEAGRAAAQDARPIDDHRGSAEYRLWIVETLVRRALSLAYARAMGW
ncbi:MAG: FAD binding domain-containing protein [Thermodesulfobacteriota bacterium]